MDRPGDTAELLRFLFTRMDEQLQAGEQPVEPPALLRLDGAEVACAVDGVNLHVKHFEGHPAPLLAGWTAPLEWFGIGVLTTGWAYEPGVERRRVRVMSMLCRDGVELSASRCTGDDELRFLEGPSVGMVSDTLRRVLEMPTPPPDVSIADWLAGCWLDIVARSAKRNRRAKKLTWRQAAALHPAIQVVGARPDELPEVAPRTAAAMRWERFRRAAVREGNELAGWMDEGMFARHQVYGRPPIAVLLQRASRRLTPDARERIASTLAGWGLLSPGAGHDQLVGG